MDINGLKNTKTYEVYVRRHTKMLGYVDMRKAVPVTFSVIRIRIIWILQGMIKQALFDPDQEYIHSASNIVRDRNLRVSDALYASEHKISKRKNGM
jgi:hypothetical protein